MNSQIKKSYIAPQLTVHGNVEKLTEQNGSRFNDTPFGSPSSPNDNGNPSFFN
jgi:hypothetical protein